MNFNFTAMTMPYLKEIDSWNYESFVEQVMMTPYFDSFNMTGQLIGPGGCEGFVALLDGEPVGLFEFILKDGVMEIGLALKPDLIGTGLGAGFVTQGIAFGQRHYAANFDYIQLTVESANKAAICVYEKVGFTQVVQNDQEIEMRMAL